MEGDPSSSKIRIQKKESLADIWQENFLLVSQKMESQLPLYVKAYSDFFREYKASLPEMTKKWKKMEKDFFKNYEINENWIVGADNYWNMVTGLYLFQIESFTKFLKMSLDTRISFMKSWNNFTRIISSN